MGGYLVYLNDIAGMPRPRLYYFTSWVFTKIYIVSPLYTLTLTQSNLAIVYFYMKKEPFSVRLSPREYRVVVVLCWGGFELA